MNYLGIEQGKGGGAALLNSTGELINFIKVPVIGKEYDGRAMAGWIKYPLRSTSPTPDMKGVIEKVGAFPGQGVTAMFNFGMGWGLWRGMLAAHGVSYEMVLPRQWQTIVSFPAGMAKPERKKAVIAWARRRWPEIPNHSGVCEGACMAEWLRRREVGVQLSYTGRRGVGD